MTRADVTDRGNADQIGYYHLCGADPSVIKGTDFQSYGDVFGGAWSRITRAIETAYRHGIGVLIGACVMRGLPESC